MKNFKKQFGGKMTKELEAQYGQSPHWKNGSFQNLIETNMGLSFWDIPELLYKQFTNRTIRVPKNPLPVQAFNKEAFLKEEASAKFIWYGHSALLLRINNKTILIDPMLGPDTSPIAPINTKRFSQNTLDLIDSFPEIDLMMISHDHYDHLDFDSIQKLKKKTKAYYVGFGVKRHLISWGVKADLIDEFDWWQDQEYNGIKITYTPTRHFSGRGLTDRLKSLWGGWVFKTKKENIWFSGDGGFGNHFEEIGKRLGPFDFAFMECGQYNEKWRPIHLFPDESVQAALMAGVRKAMPVHWGGFALSQHPWKEPVEEFDKYAVANQLNTIYPRLGELFYINKSNDEKWWKEV